MVAITKRLVILSDVAFAAVQDKASNGGRRGQKLFALQAKTTFGHRKSGKRERIRNILKKKNGLPQPFTRLRNDGRGENGLPRA